jgi:hypothetical protein
VAIDFFAVATATFRVLFVFVVLSHERRWVLHFGVTEHPTEEWTMQQMREAAIPVTLKLPPRTVELLRKCAKSSGLTVGATVTAALNALLRTLKRHG